MVVQVATEDRIILGVDPGFTATGYSVLRCCKGQTELIDCGFLALPANNSLEQRLGQFYDFFIAKIASHKINEIALETPFLGKNAQNFLKLGYLRGLLLLLACQNRCRVREFSPRSVKLAITGSGGADKEQVMRVVMRLFPRLGVPHRHDITDAIAVSLCCLWCSNNI